MGISFAPFDDPVAPKPPMHLQRTMRAPSIQRDSTECNYIIMFFIAGVFLLCLFDSM